MSQNIKSLAEYPVELDVGQQSLVADYFKLKAGMEAIEKQLEDIAKKSEAWKEAGKIRQSKFFGDKAASINRAVLISGNECIVQVLLTYKPSPKNQVYMDPAVIMHLLTNELITDEEKRELLNLAHPHLNLKIGEEK